MNPIHKAWSARQAALAALVGGAAGALLGNGTAGAQTTTTAPAPSSDGTTARPSFPSDGTAEHEGLQKPVTGDAATKAGAAAVADVGSGAPAT